MNLIPSQVKAQGLPENPRTALLDQLKTPEDKAALDRVARRLIIFGDEKMSLTWEEIKKVRHLLYWCPECAGYHPWPGNDLEDVKVFLDIPE